MSLGITQEHRELADTLGRWAGQVVPLTVARSWLDQPETDPVGDLEFWSSLAQQGLLAMHLPEEIGGAGYGSLELAVALEQAGRGLIPGPLLPTTVASSLLAGLDTSPLAKELVPGLADGSTTAAVAVGCSPLAGEASAEGLVVSGTLGPVVAGGRPDLVIAPVDTADETRWVVLDTAELQVAFSRGLDATRAVMEVTAEAVEVPSDRIATGLTTALVEDTTAALAAAEAAGIADWCTATAAEYARTRVQFGRPIGQFQAVKHLCAAMLVRTEQARAVAWDAARALDDPDQRPLTSAVAAAVALEAAVENAKDCIQVLGGIGFTWEHDAHMFLKRALSMRQWLGGAARWNRRVAGLTLDGARRSLELDLGEEGDSLRTGIRNDLQEIADAEDTRRALADNGFMAPHWPRPWGRDAGPVEQLVIAEELAAAGVKVPSLVIGAWVLPTLIAHGTTEQQQGFIPPTLHGEITWCQMFSEPEAGSDLASLRTRATRVDGGWVLQGQKVWTSLAHHSDWAICLARTNPDAPKHKGITYFLVDMTSDGLDIRPLREITGDAMFNEVFLNEVFVPDDCVVGEVDGGWALARATLANERVAMSTGSTMGRGVEGLLAVLDGHVDADDPVLRDRLGRLVCEATTLSLLGFRTTLSQLDGLDPGSGSSVRKLIGMDHAQDVAELVMELSGPDAVAMPARRDDVVGGFVQTRALTIAGGTTQVQRNVVAERILGLPRDEEGSK